MKVAGDNMFKWKDAPTIEEESKPIVNLDSVTRQKLFELTNPKVSVARTSAKSIFMEQMTLLEKMDHCRLKRKKRSSLCS